MSGLWDLSREVAREYRLTLKDAIELVQFINDCMLKRMARGEVLHIDRFGSYHAEDGKIWFNPSEHMVEYIRQYSGPKVKKEKKRGDRWKHLHQDYVERLKQLDDNNNSGAGSG